MDRARQSRGAGTATIEDYERHRGHILALLDPDTKLAKLTHARCEKPRDDLLKAHGRSTARKVLVSFKSILGDAERRRDSNQDHQS